MRLICSVAEQQSEAWADGMIQAFHEVAARAARQWPDRTALVYKNERLSYADFWSAVQHAATFFKK